MKADSLSIDDQFTKQLRSYCVQYLRGLRIEMKSLWFRCAVRQVHCLLKSWFWCRNESGAAVYSQSKVWQIAVACCNLLNSLERLLQLAITT